MLQVTPVMGMVQDMQKRWAAGAGPKKVHLIFVAGTKTEMAVLDCETINDARCVLGTPGQASLAFQYCHGGYICLG